MSRQWHVLAISGMTTAAGSIMIVGQSGAAGRTGTVSAQILAICLAFGVSGILYLVRKPPIAILLALAKIFCVYFVIKAGSASVTALACVLFAFHFELFFFLPLAPASFIAFVLFRVVMAAAAPHTAWDSPIEEVTRGGYAVMALVSLAASLSGSLTARLAAELERKHASITRLEDAVRNLTETNAAYQTYATYIEENSKEAERNRLTREIHDIVGYSMTNLLMIVQAALYSENQDQVTELLQKAQTHINESMNEVRAALRRLRSTQKKALHGTELIRYLTENFSRVTGIEVRLDVIAFPRDIAGNIEEIIYRMLQECMTNSFRHGRATEIDITFQMHRNVLFLKIRDNGTAEQTGFPSQAGAQAPSAASETGEGIGLAGMRERVEGIGGTVTTVAGADGFTVFARMPYGEAIA